MAPCRWSLLGRVGHLGEAIALLLQVHRPGAERLSLRAASRCSGGMVTEGRPEPPRCGFNCQGGTG